MLILSPFFVAIFSQAVSFSRVQLGWRTLKGPLRPGRQGSRDPTADCTRGLVFSSLASLSTHINVGFFWDVDTATPLEPASNFAQWPLAVEQKIISPTSQKAFYSQTAIIKIIL